MKNHRIHRLLASLALGAAIVVGSAANGATLNDVLAAAARLNVQAKTSQGKIDALTEETRELYNDYKVVLKQIEGLRVYNRQLEKQIGAQEAEMAQISTNIDQVTIIERQITPLMMRMIDGIDQFVKLDIPFLTDERRDRVTRLREMMDRADVAVSEKFSQVLRAYQVENDYGRTIKAYSGTIDVDGANRIVDILQMGRVALVYQTSDGEETGMWDKTANKWVTLDDSYTLPVKNGIRMARKQLSVDMLSLPVSAPEGT